MGLSEDELKDRLIAEAAQVEQITSAETALVDALGAEFIGIKKKRGEFVVEDSEDLENEILEQALVWLRRRRLMSRTDGITLVSVTGIPWGDGIAIRVFKGEEAWRDFSFTLAKKGPRRKRFHVVEVSELVPPSTSD